MSTPSRKDHLADTASEKVLGDFIDQALAVHGVPAPRSRQLPWYRQAFQEDYLDIYLHRDLAEAARAVRFLARALELAPDQRLLDLCCGPGRHLAFLRNYVGLAVGLDLSRVLLERAKENCGLRIGDRGENEMRNAECGMRNEEIISNFKFQISDSHSTFRIPHPALVQADMRRLPLAGAGFDRVVNLFTSFGYFEAGADNAAVLAEVARVLRPGGLFAIDHINREAMLAHIKPQTERALPDGRLLVEKRRFDEAARRVIKDVACIEPGGQAKGWTESVRVYAPDELENLLAAAGLAPQARHGDYDGGPWRPNAARLILIARRG